MKPTRSARRRTTPSSRGLPEQGHAAHGQGLEPLQQLGVPLHHLGVVEVAGNRGELLPRPVLGGRPVEVLQVALLALLLEAALPQPLQAEPALVGVAPLHHQLLVLGAEAYWSDVRVEGVPVQLAGLGAAMEALGAQAVVAQPHPGEGEWLGVLPRCHLDVGVVHYPGADPAAAGAGGQGSA